jgi:hypothetical protein
VDEVESVVCKCNQYVKDPNTFLYDLRKVARDKEALEAKQGEEEKRQTYEKLLLPR